MNAITEWAALPATEMFLRNNRDDSDFCAFMSIWFFEEQKHSLALIEYLRRFRPELVPTEEELHKVRFEFDPAPEIGRASCRERVCQYVSSSVVGVSLKKKTKNKPE